MPKKKDKKPDLGAFAVGVLNIWWDEKERSLYADGGIPRPDQNYAFDVLAGKRWYPPPLTGPNRGREGYEASFIEELERRGYDVTTFRLAAVMREHEWIKPLEWLVHRRTGERRRVHHVRWRGDSKSTACVFFCIKGDAEKFVSEFFSLAEAEREYMPATLETQMAFVGEGI